MAEPVKAEGDRLVDLEWIRDDALRRMDSDYCTDQNFVILGKLVIDAWNQINGVSGSDSTSPKTGGNLSEFEKRLAQRRRKTS
jgi:hypothetical protein